MMRRALLLYIGIAVSILLLFGLNLTTGSVQIPFADVLDILCGRFAGKESWQYIILENRLPQALTALLCGASLSVCGLMLQTAFRNPLAGPDVFGISSGAGLGVALVMLLLGGTVSTSLFTVSGFLAILTAAFLGAITVTALILFLSTLVRNSVLLLIVGIMVGYVSSSAVSLLNFFASEEGVKSYMVWGMGNFGGVSMSHIPLFSLLCLVGITAALLLVKPLNILLLGPPICRELRDKYTSTTQPTTTYRRSVNGYYNRILWSYLVYRLSYSTHSAPSLPHRQSSGTPSRDNPDGCCHSPSL